MEERADSGQDKTEEPTEERIRQFREQGNIPQSRELLASVTFGMWMIFLSFFCENIIDIFTKFFQRTWTSFNTIPDITEVCVLMASSMAVIGIVPVTLGLALNGFYLSWEKLEWKWNRINPITGVQNLFSFFNMKNMVIFLIKVVAFSSMGYYYLKNHFVEHHTMYLYHSFVLLKEGGLFLKRIGIGAGLIFIVIGVLDYALEKFLMMQKMRMTKQEVKEEMKTQEGDPQIKARRRRQARDILFRQNLRNVEKATFVITNPTHYAIAIRYYRGMKAPIVVSKGQDLLAQRIKELAKQKDIIMIENKPLARTLYKLVKIGQEIPTSLYVAIIEVMKFISLVKGKDYFKQPVI